MTHSFGPSQSSCPIPVIYGSYIKMPNKPIEELVPHTFRFVKGDVERLLERYGRRGASQVIRNLVREHLNEVQARKDSIDLDLVN